MALAGRWRSRPQHQKQTYAAQQKGRLFDHLVGMRMPYMRSTVTRATVPPGLDQMRFQPPPGKACVGRRAIMRRTQNQPKSMPRLPRKGEEHATFGRGRRKKGFPLPRGGMGRRLHEKK